MSYKGIIFDLDGTLINTLDDLTNSMNHALSELDCPPRTLDECRRFIGSGLKLYAERALPEKRNYLRDELLEIMVDHYKDHCLIRTAPYPGIPEVVQELKRCNIYMAVLTNKNQAPAESIIKHFFDDEIFNPVMGVCDDRKVKPDPDGTLEILRLWDLDVSEVIFVGDSDVDIQTALNIGIVSVGCEWGFRDRDQLIKAGADILISHPLQILDLVT